MGIIRMVNQSVFHHSYDPYLGRKLLTQLSDIIFNDMEMIDRLYLAEANAWYWYVSTLGSGYVHVPRWDQAYLKTIYKRNPVYWHSVYAAPNF